MNGSQKLLAGIVLLAICALLVVPMVIFLRVGNIALSGLWAVFICMSVALILKNSVYFMSAGKIVLLSCFGNIYDIFSSKIPGKNGTLNSGILVTIPIIVNRHILPWGQFLVSLESNNVAYTKADAEDPTTSVKVYAHIQVQLNPDLEKLSQLIHLMNAGAHYDFTEEVWGRRYVSDPDSVMPKFENERCVCLATFIQGMIQVPFDEAVVQAIPFFTLQETLSNLDSIQQKIIGRLDAKGTVFNIHDVKTMFSVFDIKLIAITPSDEETTKAIGARSIAVRQGLATVATAEANAKAAVVTATGEAESIKRLANQLSTPEGKLAFARELTKSLPEGTQLVITPGMIDAAIAKILKAQNHS